MSELVQMPEPKLEGAFTLGPFREHHYLQPHWALLLELLHYRLAKTFRAPVVPPSIQDCSLADGDTPYRRHPGNAHDGGDDFDITYGMTGWQGTYAVGRLKQTRTGPMIQGEPFLLDVDYQAAWYTHLAMLDLEYGGLVLNAAADPAVERAVEERLGRFSVRDSTKARARSMINNSPHISWHAYHGDHTHLRMVVRRDAGELAEAFEEDVAEVLAS